MPRSKKPPRIDLAERLIAAMLPIIAEYSKDEIELAAFIYTATPEEREQLLERLKEKVEIEPTPAA